jgi:hypothetical protein
MELQETINLYLSKCLDGEGAMSDEILDRFAERCRETMRKQFNEPEREFKVSMSSVGKPLCQQQMHKAGAERERPPPNLKMKFAYGYLVENLVMAVLEAAEVGVEEDQTEVSYKLNGTTIEGTLDVVIDGKVYDIKSVSKYAYEKKFSKEDAFDKIKEDDAFGYVDQGYLYGAGRDLPFGGWIALNKETGGITVAVTPRNGEQHKKAAIADAKANAHAIDTDAPFKRCFGPVDDTYYRKPTGDKTLHLNCSYCAYKNACWGDEIEWRKRKKGAGMKWMFV